MKTKDIVALYAALRQLSEDPTPRPARFVFAVARNMQTLEPIVMAFQEALQGEWMPPLQAFEKDRQELLTRHTRHTASGSPMIIDGNQTIVDNPAEYAAELEELQTRHPEAKGAQVRFAERQEELLDIEEDVSLRLIALNELPEFLAAATMRGLLPMVIDDEPAESS